MRAARAAGSRISALVSATAEAGRAAIASAAARALRAQFGKRTRRVRDAPVDGLPGVHRLAEHEHRKGPRMADPRRQRQAGCGLRHEREVHKRRGQQHIFRHEDEIAVQQHGRPDAHRPAVHRRHERRGRPSQRGEQRIAARRRPLRRRLRAVGRGEVAQVVARGEHVALRLDEHRNECRGRSRRRRYRRQAPGTWPASARSSSPACSTSG